MLTISIPGRESLTLSHLILDYNGTIAEDGLLIPGIAPRLEELSKTLHICVITADTHGTAADQCKDLPVELVTFPAAEAGPVKAELVRRCGGGTACIGNGFNDIQMFDAADLSVCVIGSEGCCGLLLGHADVVVTSIEDALDLLAKPQRLRATLRT